MSRELKYSRNFLRWATYFAGGELADPVGLDQFYRLETFGERPADPSPNFIRLSNGRSMFNALQKEVRESYLGSEWQGIEHDRRIMPGWLFTAFYGWHPSVKGAA